MGTESNIDSKKFLEKDNKTTVSCSFTLDLNHQDLDLKKAAEAIKYGMVVKTDHGASLAIKGKQVAIWALTYAITHYGKGKGQIAEEEVPDLPSVSRRKPFNPEGQYGLKD